MRRRLVFAGIAMVGIIALMFFPRPLWREAYQLGSCVRDGGTVRVDYTYEGDPRFAVFTEYEVELPDLSLRQRVDGPSAYDWDDWPVETSDGQGLRVLVIRLGRHPLRTESQAYFLPMSRKCEDLVRTLI